MYAFYFWKDNACSMGFNCPVKDGDALFESVTLPILTEYPKVNIVFKFLEWEFKIFIFYFR